MSNNRGNLRPSESRHKGKCSVCNHSERNEIESMYLDFTPAREIAEEFGISDDSVYNHAHFYALDERRGADTERMLKVIAAKGFQQFSRTGVSEKVWVEVVKELNRVTGQRVGEQKNPVDSAREFLLSMKERMPDLSEMDLFELSIKSKPQWKDLTPERLGIAITELEG